MKAVFMGTPDIAAEVLKSLLNSKQFTVWKFNVTVAYITVKIRKLLLAYSHLRQFFFNRKFNILSGNFCRRVLICTAASAGT